SCDETAAAIVRDGCQVLSSIVHSQVALHAPHGGVVPEIASRSHVERLPGVIRQALTDAHIGWDALDGVAVTYGPGLASSLLVGLSTAKGLALALNRPLIGINHIEAHIHSVFLSPDAPPREAMLPLLALVVSGGHTCLVRVAAGHSCRVIGQTLDDAAGEAFDKAAQLLGLGYPGGPAMEKAANRAARRNGIVFPHGRIQSDNPSLGALRAELCFSFSGLKTALMYRMKRQPPADAAERDELAAAYQEAIVSALVTRCGLALRRERFAALAAGGGVSLNGLLRNRLAELAASRHVPLLLAEPRYCGDNAAMIAALAGGGGGVRGPKAMTLDATPGLALSSVEACA
ncbi:MAG: tRNA (adenosine(37)-N6)-threonylcarbamoyltransferase complex transferase subunit TsaD, partial [Kiritimatiellae bacterium]|nr:tRNA (adenosine(37)-N6)-threonylcarbamoyltransferase complex transferase subunit TsaD [Kiritimatiellia bacterium]